MKLFLFILTMIIFSSKLPAQITFGWVKQFGGLAYEGVSRLQLDSNGDIIVVGTFEGKVDFDPGIDTFYFTAKGDHDIFIAKFSNTGNFLWAKAIECNGPSFFSNYIADIKQDTLGNILAVGVFDNTIDFDPGASIFNLVPNGSQTTFAAKYNNNGDFVWAKQFDNCRSYSLAVDPFSNVIISGMFNFTVDFDPNIGVYNLAANSGDDDIFICKLNSSGGFIWAKQIGSLNSSESQYAITSDNQGNLYSSCHFIDTVDFDPGAGIYNLFPQNGIIALLKLDSSGNFLWAKNFCKMTSLGTSYSYQIEIDGMQNIILSGHFKGSVDMDPGLGASNLISNGLYDHFICKVDSVGDFVWAKSFGGINEDNFALIALDIESNIFITGRFKDTVDFDPNLGEFNLVSSSKLNVFISKLDTSGNFVWAKQLKCNGNAGVGGIKIDSAQNIYIVGAFEDTCDFDITQSQYNLASSGDYDAFILKLSQWPVSVTNLFTSSNIILYPNPTTDMSDLLFKSNNEGKYKINIHSIDGKLIKSIQGNYYSGANKINIDSSNQASSIYFVDIYLNNQKSETLKLIKH